MLRKSICCLAKWCKWRIRIKAIRRIQRILRLIGVRWIVRVIRIAPVRRIERVFGSIFVNGIGTDYLHRTDSRGSVDSEGGTGSPD
jgi:hypothetical protein